jgi:uncharacterized protein (TIGR02466 family)
MGGATDRRLRPDAVRHEMEMALPGPQQCCEPRLRRRAAPLTLAALLLFLCAYPFEPAMARKRTKSRASARQPNYPRRAGGTAYAPAPLITTVGSDANGGAASVHHLFATPLYVADLSSSVEAATLSSLALEGYSIVAESSSVQKAMIDLKLATMPTTEQAAPEIVAQLGDNSKFTNNDKFFYYQIANSAKCATDALPACGNVRWDSYFTSSARQQLQTAIMAAVPRYFAHVGVAQRELPPYTIKMWASVMTSGASHTEHEHSSAGECLASGVFYAATPTGSGAIRFRDHRQHLESHPLAFPTTSGYDLQPAPGQLVMFPPWLLHQVLPSEYEEHQDKQPLRVSWAFNVMVDNSREAGLDEAVAAQEDMLDGLLGDM